MALDLRRLVGCSVPGPPQPLALPPAVVREHRVRVAYQRQAQRRRLSQGPSQSQPAALDPERAARELMRRLERLEAAQQAESPGS